MKVVCCLCLLVLLFSCRTSKVNSNLQSSRVDSLISTSYDSSSVKKASKSNRSIVLEDVTAASSWDDLSALYAYLYTLEVHAGIGIDSTISSNQMKNRKEKMKGAALHIARVVISDSNEGSSDSTHLAKKDSMQLIAQHKIVIKDKRTTSVKSISIFLLFLFLVMAYFIYRWLKNKYTLIKKQ